MDQGVMSYFSKITVKRDPFFNISILQSFNASPRERQIDPLETRKEGEGERRGSILKY
jgi:hypothetical protein